MAKKYFRKITFEVDGDFPKSSVIKVQVNKNGVPIDFADEWGTLNFENVSGDVVDLLTYSVGDNMLIAEYEGENVAIFNNFSVAEPDTEYVDGGKEGSVKWSYELEVIAPSGFNLDKMVDTDYLMQGIMKK
ncbi:MAG: hypothetical protein IIX60_00730 [Clostridia bacterium]|nr:hypothetical protein [Clostridia bacterium]MBQ2174984.1 hypothetical protein [Alphaproteobacteria bacterium]